MDYAPDFRETLDLIYSFTWNGRKNRKNRGDKAPPSLDVMHALMDSLGKPHLAYPVIHIAGTKGKGSTANFIANTLKKAGYKVGLYTSPHLHDFSERIKVNGVLIPHEEISKAVKQMIPFFELHPEINTFEIITAIAFDYFRNEKVDIAVVEVGLGGRFDATNVVEPLLSVITSISFDHMDLLGDTLEKIAFEKAGIIKQGIPVVIGKQIPEVMKVLLDTANEQNAIAKVVDEELCVSAVTTSPTGHTFTLTEKTSGKFTLRIPLLGLHQVENASLAYISLLMAQKLGLKLTDEDIQKGFLTVQWPARFEIISADPLIVIDGAHNVDSVVRVLETMDLVFPDKSIHLLFGASLGKDIEGMLEKLLSKSEYCIFTRSVHPKSVTPERLVQLANQLGYITDFESTIENALQKSLDQLHNNTVLLCTGSLFVAAAVQSIWKNNDVKE